MFLPLAVDRIQYFKPFDKNVSWPSHGNCKPSPYAVPRSDAALSFSVQLGSDHWKAEIVANTLAENCDSYNNHDDYEQLGHDEAGGSWNTLRHRRVHSAPNIMEYMSRDLSSPSSSQRHDPGPPWLASEFLKAGIRDSAIPEGRRFEVRMFALPDEDCVLHKILSEIGVALLTVSSCNRLLLL